MAKEQMTPKEWEAHKRLLDKAITRAEANVEWWESRLRNHLKTRPLKPSTPNQHNRGHEADRYRDPA